MKNKTFLRFSFLFSFCAVSLLTVGDLNKFNLTKVMANPSGHEISGVTTDPKQYIGYGYNVASGKALYEADALMLNSPILETSNENLMKKIKVFDGSKTEYQSYASKRVRDVSKWYGNTLNAGAGIGAGISSFAVDISAKFNMSDTMNWNRVSNEEYSFYTIFSGNRPVVLQLDYDELQDYLTTSFKEDLTSVKDKTGAEKLFNKYGTHLLTGYTLGGIFEMTNYYATCSDTYNKESNTSFTAQVSAALGSFASGNLDFSFTNNYGYKDNNAWATNQYKCTTYGGLSFPGLTIDQAFSWYETLTGAGYVYQLWTDSINAGKNLVIVGIPQSSKMIPLWDLLPFEKEYYEARNMLMQAYSDITSKKYNDYNENHKDRYIGSISNVLAKPAETPYHDYGFNYATKDAQGRLCTSNIKSETIASSESFVVKDGSYIYMDYNVEDFVGQDVEWTVSNDTAKVIDPRSGVFEVMTRSDDKPRSFKITCVANGMEVFSRNFKLTSQSFSGGDGSIESPYIIATVDDFKTFAGSQQYWSEDVNVKLIRDLDFEGQNIDLIGGDVEYKGTFDGAYHTIKNFGVDKRYTSTSLFGTNVGTIQNLNVDWGGNVELKSTNGFISGLALINSKTGVIKNCTISNFNVNFTNLGVGNIEDLPSFHQDVSIGGIASKNSGIINDCTVKDSSLSAVITGPVNSVEIGGIAAYSKSGKTPCAINKCETNNTPIYLDIKNATPVDASISTAIGGITGALRTGATMTNCIVKNSAENQYVSLGIDYRTNNNAAMFVGGLVGVASTNTTRIENCIVLNSDKITNNDVFDTQKNEYVGILLGYADADLPIKNCYVETNSVTANIYNGYNRNELNNNPNIIIRPRLSKIDFSNSITNDYDNWYFVNNEIFLNIFGINFDTLQLVLDDVKQEFYLGEEFTYNNLKVQGLYTDGSEFEDQALIVNPTKYNKNALGVYQIAVEVYGVELYYNVTVVEHVLNNIYVKELAKKTYYVGDNEVDPSTYEVHMVTKSGRDTVITNKATDFNHDGYKMIVPEKGFVAGNNVIIFEYEGMTYNFNVTAKERAVDHIEVNENSIKNRVFAVGSANLDFSDIDVTVYYKNNEGMKNVKGSDCDFIMARVVAGQNTVTVTYDVVNTDTFVIEGKNVVDEELIKSFIDVVNTIDSSKDLRTQYTTLTKAYNLYQKIGDHYIGEETYTAAKTKYLEAIEAYNDLINNINNDFVESTKPAEVINFINISRATCPALAIIILKILERLF